MQKYHHPKSIQKPMLLGMLDSWFPAVLSGSLYWLQCHYRTQEVSGRKHWAQWGTRYQHSWKQIRTGICLPQKQTHSRDSFQWTIQSVMLWLVVMVKGECCHREYGLLYHTFSHLHVKGDCNGCIVNAEILYVLNRMFLWKWHGHS